MSPHFTSQLIERITPGSALVLGVAVILSAWWMTARAWVRNPRESRRSVPLPAAARRAPRMWDLASLNTYYAEERDTRASGDGVSN